MPRKTGFMLLVVVNVLCYCMLSFYQTGAAQSGSPRPTLSNPVDQHRELMSSLDDIKTLLKEQNTLLASGRLKVIVAETPKN